jgi:hypothetical protein
MSGLDCLRMDIAMSSRRDSLPDWSIRMQANRKLKNMFFPETSEVEPLRKNRKKSNDGNMAELGD